MVPKPPKREKQKSYSSLQRKKEKKIMPWRKGLFDHWERVNPTQRQMGNISPSVRKEVRIRSGGYCEVGIQCKGARATQQAHKKGRRIIENKTTAADLWDACDECHDWIDKTGEGVKWKRGKRD